MSLLKKISAVALTAAMALSFASCGKNATWGAKIDGTELRAGIFIYFQSDAFSRAYEYQTDENTDIMDLVIEDKPIEDWVNDEAVKGMQEYVAVENKFVELGLSFEEGKEEEITANVEQWWDYVSEYFEGIGVSKESYIDVVINAEKKSMIFDYYYGEGGELEVSEEDIKTYLNENFARIKYIDMPLKGADGNTLEPDMIADTKVMALDYIDRMKSGESFEDISAEYDDYVASLSADSSEEPVDDTVDSEETTDEPSEELLLGSVTSAEYPVPSASVHEKVVGDAMEVGEYILIEEETVFYIVHKMDLFADENYYDYKKDDVIDTLKGDEFDATVAGWTASQDVDVNEAAIRKYKVSKLNEE